MSSQNPAEKEESKDEEQLIPPAAKRNKVIKYKKCRKEFHSDMISCKNPNCNTSLCHETCLPKRFVMGSEFFCCKKCKT